MNKTVWNNYSLSWGYSDGRLYFQLMQQVLKCWYMLPLNQQAKKYFHWEHNQVFTSAQLGLAEHKSSRSRRASEKRRSPMLASALHAFILKSSKTEEKVEHKKRQTTTTYKFCLDLYFVFFFVFECYVIQNDGRCLQACSQ